MQKKYQRLVLKAERLESESRELKQLALELYQLGYIRGVNKIEQIKISKQLDQAEDGNLQRNNKS
jgi:hypothetical protein